MLNFIVAAFRNRNRVNQSSPSDQNTPSDQSSPSDQSAPSTFGFDCLTYCIVKSQYSAKHSVMDDFYFLRKHAIFECPPNENTLTDRHEILHIIMPACSSINSPKMFGIGGMHGRDIACPSNAVYIIGPILGFAPSQSANMF